MEKLGGRATLPLVLQWRGAGGTDLALLSLPSLEKKWSFTGPRLKSRWMKATKIGRQGPITEIGEIGSRKTHGDSRVHIPFSTRQVMCGCGEFGRYKLNFQF